jgi:hypothetical protein
MSDNLMNSDTAAVLVILAAVTEALDVQQPGIKNALAETLLAAVKNLPDPDSPLKETLQRFHGIITRDNLIEMLFH